MNRIESMFSRLKEEGRTAFIPFLTGGDPNIAFTEKMVRDIIQDGADLVEIGVPFSDPMAEGPVIQAANERALADGTTPDDCFALVARLRKDNDKTPLVFLLYYNTMLHYGLDAFFARCQEVGVDGLIIPDLPYEESSEIDSYTQKYGVVQIMMVAPTSRDRLEQICAKAEGFLYCVSSLGVTGIRTSFADNLTEFVGEARKLSKAPACIGFGVSTPEQAKELRQICDGVIVGSAIVKRIGASDLSEAERNQSVRGFVRSMRKALDE